MAARAGGARRAARRLRLAPRRHRRRGRGAAGAAHRDRRAGGHRRRPAEPDVPAHAERRLGVARRSCRCSRSSRARSTRSRCTGSSAACCTAPSRRLGSEGSWRRSRQTLALAATPLALALLTFWPIRIAVYGQDLFRTGGDDYGRSDAIFGGVYLGIVAWCVLLLLIGVRAVHGWTWGRSAAAVALAAAFPALIVAATSL